MPWLPPSRPRPDSFVPPKGTAACETAPSLTPTCADVDRSAPGRVDGLQVTRPGLHHRVDERGRGGTQN